MKSIFFPLLFATSLTLQGNEIWVDAGNGDDSFPGTKEQPLATIDAGLDRLEPGVTLHVLPRDKPWPTDIRITRSGTEANPIVVDGHGSLASGRTEVPLSEWTRNEDGTFQRSLPNNAWGMPSHWEGGFPLVWFDGEPGKNVTSRKELTAGTCFLYKNQPNHKTDPLHNTLLIRLPEGKDPDSIRIEAITGEGGIYVGGSHVVVKNFVVEYGGRDGYATHRNTGVVFENVEARYFMDQGMSHHGAEVVVRNSWFHNNAGAGIVDVYPEAKVRYENCRIENDTWRGGVEFHSGEFEMIGCTIRGNSRSGVTVARGARVVIRDSLIEGGEDRSDERIGVKVGEGSELTLKHSTIRGFKIGMKATVGKETAVTLDSCHFEKNGTHLDFTEIHREGQPNFLGSDQVTLKKNGFESAGFRRTFKEESNSRWSVKAHDYSAPEYSDFAEHWGGDPTSSARE